MASQGTQGVGQDSFQERQNIFWVVEVYKMYQGNGDQKFSREKIFLRGSQPAPGNGLGSGG